MTEVGIIDAGPAGPAAARYLASEGFEPVLFEQGSAIGASGVAIACAAASGRRCAPTRAGS